ncbi:MAG: 5'/3'-nucleotidase SurE [candidate division WOR-3 bacterium]
MKIGRSCVKRVILLTNDDGIDAPGLALLHEGIKDLGEVHVIAPVSNQSGASHSFSLRRPIPVREIRPGWIAVDGTPTDCVLISHHALLGRSIALLISGINDGPNLGEDVLYSGTVAAAIEGTLLGIPSLAISFERPGINHEAAISLARQMAMHLLKKPLPSKTLLNINIPAQPINGIRITRLGKRIYRDKAIRNQSPSGAVTYLIDGETDCKLHRGSDFEAVHKGRISITPLHLDMTSYRQLRRFRRELSGLRV